MIKLLGNSYFVIIDLQMKIFSFKTIQNKFIFAKFDIEINFGGYTSLAASGGTH